MRVDSFADRVYARIQKNTTLVIHLNWLVLGI